MKHAGFVICEDFLSQNAETFISPRKKKLLINYFQKLSFTLTIWKTISQHPSQLSPQVVLLMREMPLPTLYLLPKSSSHFSSHRGRSQPWLSILGSIYLLIFNCNNNIQFNLFSPLWRNLRTPSWFFDSPPVPIDTTRNGLCHLPPSHPYRRLSLLQSLFY